MTAQPDGTPPALLHNLKHNKVLHEQVVLLTVHTEEMPARRRTTSASRSSRWARASTASSRATASWRTPTSRRRWPRLQEPGLDLEPMATTFFLGRETLIATKQPGMALWREKLFALMARNARAGHGVLPAAAEPGGGAGGAGRAVG